MVLHQQIPVFLQLIGSLYLFVHAHQQQDLLFVDVQVAGGSDLFGFLQQFQAGFIAFGSVFLCHACFHQNYVIVVRSHLVVYVLAYKLFGHFVAFVSLVHGCVERHDIRCRFLISMAVDAFFFSQFGKSFFQSCIAVISCQVVVTVR